MRNNRSHFFVWDSYSLFFMQGVFKFPLKKIHPKSITHPKSLLDLNPLYIKPSEKLLKPLSLMWCGLCRLWPDAPVWAIFIWSFLGLCILGYQWRIQKDFYTGIPAWAPKFWRPKNEIYIYLHYPFELQTMFLPFKSN